MEVYASFFSGAPAFIRRSDFPKDFVFGSATAAFQIEGGQDKGGRGDSIWDPYAEEHELFKPYTEDAVNHYEKFPEDVELMKQIGFDAYRFSISWPRILPTGKIESRNQEGIDYYKNLIKKLRENGIEPFVTLFHWDLPLALQQEYNGFLDRRVADDFAVYADVCFKEFGEYVDHWITMNEPFTFAYSAHVTNVHAPGLGTVHEALFNPGTNDGTAKAATTEKAGNGKAEEEEEEDDDDGGSIFHPSRSTIHEKTERKKIMVFKPVTDWASEAQFLDEFSYPYVVTHNQLLAHAKAVEVFKKKYQDAAKKKQIGITLVSMWFEPRNPEDEKDKAAALRALDFFIGWYLDPLVKGDYPKSMREYVKKEHLPEMSAEDRKLIQGSYDFIGVNYYTARYVAHKEKKKYEKIGRNYVTDQKLMYYESRKSATGEDVPIGKDTGASAWLISYPKGMKELMLYIKNNYNDPVIYITENGIDDLDDESSRLWTSFFDQKRVTHLHDHLTYLLEAIREGAKVKGYFVWSLLDNFEWNNGFHARFGLIYVDYKTGNRHPKLSAAWLNHFLKSKEEGSSSSSSQIQAIESQIKDLNSQIAALIAKVDALPSTAEIDFNSPANRTNIAKILVSSCQIPVVQEAIGKGLLRWASAEGAKLWDLAHWQSLLDSSKHKYYGGGVNLQAAVIGHPTKHGINITIPTSVDDKEFSKIRNAPNNNDVKSG